MLGTALRWMSPGGGLWHRAVISSGEAPPSSKGEAGLFQQWVVHTQAVGTSRAGSCLPAAGAMRAAEQRVVP